jgi:hypothetical protein
MQFKTYEGRPLTELCMAGNVNGTQDLVMQQLFPSGEVCGNVGSVLLMLAASLLSICCLLNACRWRLQLHASNRIRFILPSTAQ